MYRFLCFLYNGIYIFNLHVHYVLNRNIYYILFLLQLHSHRDSYIRQGTIVSKRTDLFAAGEYVVGFLRFMPVHRDVIRATCGDETLDFLNGHLPRNHITLVVVSIKLKLVGPQKSGRGGDQFVAGLRVVFAVRRMPAFVVVLTGHC